MHNKTTKIVLITASSKRIGKEIAIYLAKRGWKIVIHYNNSKDEAEITKQELDKITSSLIIKADFNNEEETRTMFRKINECFGIVDLLINNAACFKKDNFNNTPLEIWEENFKINLRTPILLIQQFINQKHNHNGNIINILDYCVKNIQDSYLSYSLSKAGIYSLTESLAKKLAPNIRINSIAPGPAMLNKKYNKTIFEQSWKNSPLKKSTNSKEICNTIKFLLDTKTITGQTIFLDGGKHLIDNNYF